jgi:hypothetical protein
MYIRLTIFIVIIMTCLPTAYSMAGDKLDLKISHNRVSERLRTPRLELGTIEKERTDLDIEGKKVKRSPTVEQQKVFRGALQRRQKTKRVVATQE